MYIYTININHLENNHYTYVMYNKQNTVWKIYDSLVLNRVMHTAGNYVAKKLKPQKCTINLYTSLTIISLLKFNSYFQEKVEYINTENSEINLWEWCIQINNRIPI